MPDDTDTDTDAETMEFLDFLEQNLPDTLPGEGVVAACAVLIGGYAPNPHKALLWVMALASELRLAYEKESDGECMCDACTAERKSHAN